MKVQRVAVTRLCNQNCAFCTERGPVEEVFHVKPALETLTAREMDVLLLVAKGCA